MGYTHYFAYRPQDPQWAEAWPALVDDIYELTRVAEEEGYDLAGGLGEGRPEIGPDRIWLNGAGDEGHETFHLAGPAPADSELGTEEHVFGFCKTARKEYDGVVCAILLRAAQVAPEAMLIGSDGEWGVEWEAGAGEGPAARPLLRAVFGTDAMPPAAHEYFTTNAEAEAIFRRIDISRGIIREVDERSLALPLADHLFGDEPGIGL